MRIVERARAHYEVEEVEHGKVYRWQPETLVVECVCGEEAALTHSETACEECGTEHAGLVREDLSERQLQGDEDIQPWRYAEDNEGAGVPF